MNPPDTTADIVLDGAPADSTSGAPQHDMTPGEKIIDRCAHERRKFRRVRVTLAGRLYIPANQEEALCTVEDISPGDAMLLCELKQEPKGRAVIYLDGLGRFEGPVVRAEEGGFVMTFSCSAQKREKLVDHLTLELNRHLLGEGELRRHDRVEAQSGSYTHFTRSTGDQIRCEVLDLSLTGVSVRTDARPPVGEHILIGSRAGRVARHHPDGIDVEFLVAASQQTDHDSSNLDTLIPMMPRRSFAVVGGTNRS